ncbi:hypothetical protein [Nitrolancea hollandica]|nr:hypothetical protein [Nitrolancea hollandica]
MESDEARKPGTSPVPSTEQPPPDEVPESTGPIWTPSPSAPFSTDSPSFYRPRPEPARTRRALPAAAIIGLAIVLIVGAFVAFDFMNQREQVGSTDPSSAPSGIAHSATPAASATPRPSPTAVAASPSPSPSVPATAEEGNPESTPAASRGDQSAYVPSWIDDSGSDSNGRSPGGGSGGNDANAGSSHSPSQASNQTPPNPSTTPSDPPAPSSEPSAPPAQSPAPSTQPAPSPVPSDPPAPSPSPSSAPGHFGPAEPVAAIPGCTYVMKTQHNICGGFRDYWNHFNGQAIYGLPLTEEFQENGVTVQYFERARFEWHPGSDTKRYDVVLGLVGKTVTAGRSAEAPFQPTSANTNCDFHAPTGHNLCGGFRDYWKKSGGLAVFGHPISEEFEERNPDDGQMYTVQYFERARFEWHPGSGAKQSFVMLGRLGAQELQIKYGVAT